jgi:hypothetical protein
MAWWLLFAFWGGEVPPLYLSPKVFKINDIGLDFCLDLEAICPMKKVPGTPGLLP